MTTSKSICATTTWGTPSGNYDGSSSGFITDATTAAAYYYGYGSIQTVTITVTGFVGKIAIEASLNDLVDGAAFFRTESFIATTPTTGIFPFTVVGNFVWLRCAITDFSAGTIDSIVVTY